jgi:hypothetical protein
MINRSLEIIVTLYAEPKPDQGGVEGRGGLLTLGFQTNCVVCETKMRKGEVGYRKEASEIFSSRRTAVLENTASTGWSCKG